MMTPVDVKLGGAGLGMVLLDKRGKLAFVHAGAHGGFAGIAVGYPELGQGAVVLTNGDLGRKLYEEILARIAAEYRWPV